MIFSAEPSAFGDYQARTARMTQPTMVGITSIPKRCKCVCCKKLRTEATGKHTDSGFVCGMCGGLGNG